MRHIVTALHLGAEHPFSVLHVSDTHLTLADGRDDERKNRLAEHRTPVFPSASENLDKVTRLARERRLTVIHTGDLIDFVSEANLERARQFTDEVDCFMAAGNHEFSLYVGEAKEDAAYREISLNRVQSVFKNDIRFCSRVINGINFVAIDNGYYLIEPWQLDRLKKEIGRGLPMVAVLHTPLYSPEMYEISMEIHHNGPAYLMSVPEEKMGHYPPDRYEQQKEDAVTAEAFALLTGTPLIRAVLTGHLHRDYQCMLRPGLPQIMTGLDTVRELVID